MMSFPIPVVAIGPGSQPADDEMFTMLDIPSDMHTFRAPINELEAPPEVIAAALDFLRLLAAAMEATPYGSAEPVRFSLLGMDTAVAREINQMLGEGEVSVRGPADGLSAQETAFTGIWRIRGNGVDDVEASPFPRALVALALARPAPAAALPEPPAGLMNAPAILHEIVGRSAACRPGDTSHVINLSLLPVTPEDTAWMDEVLGRGSLAILSRGFGNCRITAAALPHVWWVQYFNGMEKLILNSVEVVDVPAVALAAEEDYGDSIVRLREWIDSLAEAT
ncbi:MAG: hydrogenase expression/formation protein [Rhodocyclaceae bacterium]|nr:hydrogenase expression/formation protein [Rhodocyclaceae bacterium]